MSRVIYQGLSFELGSVSLEEIRTRVAEACQEGRHIWLELGPMSLDQDQYNYPSVAVLVGPDIPLALLE
jgi:hypothetical protein